jgi:hypothetical protein
MSIIKLNIIAYSKRSFVMKNKTMKLLSGNLKTDKHELILYFVDKGK